MTWEYTEYIEYIASTSWFPPRTLFQERSKGYSSKDSADEKLWGVTHVYPSDDLNLPPGHTLGRETEPIAPPSWYLGNSQWLACTESQGSRSLCAKPRRASTYKTITAKHKVQNVCGQSLLEKHSLDGNDQEARLKCFQADGHEPQKIYL